MRKSCALFIMMIAAVSFTSAQKNKPSVYAGIDVVSLAEPEMGVGLPVSVRFTPRFGFLAEPTYIFHNSYMHSDWQNMKGYRLLLQPRYYYKTYDNKYVAAELRIKHLSFNNRMSFINTKANDTLSGYSTSQSQNIISFSVLIGNEWTISKNKRLWLNLNAGLGYKKRMVDYKNVPDGYSYDLSLDRSCSGLRPHYYSDDVNFLIPLNLRVLYKLN